MRGLYTSVVGSHAWGMERPDSDWDFWSIYQVPSREFLLGRRHEGGHESSGTLYGHGEPWDLSKFEIGHHINQLMKGNINHVVAVFAPRAGTMGGNWQNPAPSWKSMFKEPGNQPVVKKDLMRILAENPAKNIYRSVNGMTTANLKKYFKKGARLSIEQVNRCDHEVYVASMQERVKKLGQIRRMVEFGFRVLTTEKYEFKSVPLRDGGHEDEQNVRQWQADLEKAYHASELPEKPDAVPFEEFLIELRMGYFEHEE